MALAIKYWRRQSLDSFLSDALTYSKARAAKTLVYPIHTCPFRCQPFE